MENRFPTGLVMMPQTLDGVVIWIMVTRDAKLLQSHFLVLANRHSSACYEIVHQTVTKVGVIYRGCAGAHPRRTISIKNVLPISFSAVLVIQIVRLVSKFMSDGKSSTV